MATRSHIGKKQKDGTIKYIYCHWDGYPSGNGETLKKHYTDESKVDALLELGSLSSLGPEIGEKQDFDNIETQNMNWCLAYGRDRGDHDTQARVVASFDDFHNGNVSYYYLFEDGEWKFF